MKKGWKLALIVSWELYQGVNSSILPEVKKRKTWDPAEFLISVFENDHDRQMSVKKPQYNWLQNGEKIREVRHQSKQFRFPPAKGILSGEVEKRRSPRAKLYIGYAVLSKNCPLCELNF